MKPPRGGLLRNARVAKRGAGRRAKKTGIPTSGRESGSERPSVEKLAVGASQSALVLRCTRCRSRARSAMKTKVKGMRSKNMDKLIAAVQIRECLWDKSYRGHRNRFKLERYWNEVAAEVGTTSKLYLFFKRRVCRCPPC